MSDKVPVDPDRIASVLGHSMIRQIALEQQLEEAQRRIAELEKGGSDADQSRGSGNENSE